MAPKRRWGFQTPPSWGLQTPPLNTPEQKIRSAEAIVPTWSEKLAAGRAESRSIASAHRRHGHGPAAAPVNRMSWLRDTSAL